MGEQGLVHDHQDLFIVHKEIHQVHLVFLGELVDLYLVLR